MVRDELEVDPHGRQQERRVGHACVIGDQHHGAPTLEMFLPADVDLAAG